MLAAMMASAGTAAGQNPRPMTDVDNPARQPWVGKAHIQLPPNPGTLAIPNSVDFEVPQGKRLVVEGFSGECSAQEGPYFEVGADVTTQNVRASHYFKLDRFPYLQLATRGSSGSARKARESTQIPVRQSVRGS